MYNLLKPAIISLLLSTGSSLAIDLDTNNTTSIVRAAKTIADSIMSRYSGNEFGQVPGLFPTPYYWWESGLVWDSLINYWALTGDTIYNDIVNRALSWQVGPNNDYFPPNQTKSEGNDDQSFWALAAMTAAENGFPNPLGLNRENSNLTWIQLAENVFNSQASRWDEQTCDGGLRWQVFTFNAGYSYKNSLSNGNFYQLASRLALYTGNSTYSDWAERVLLWSTDSGLLSNETGAVFDGFDTTTNCSSVNRIQWTSSTGTYLSGAAYIQNYSSTLMNSGPPFALFVNLNKTFTQDHVIYEVACEENNVCNDDQLAFKAVVSRALARARDLTTVSNIVVNGTSADTIQNVIDAVIRASARGAAAQCSGGDISSVCGSSWLNSIWDGSQGLGQDVSALEIILATLPGKEVRNMNSSVAVGSTNVTTSTSPTISAGRSSATVESSNSGSSMSIGLLSILVVISSLALGYAV